MGSSPYALMSLLVAISVAACSSSEPTGDAGSDAASDVAADQVATDGAGADAADASPTPCASSAECPSSEYCEKSGNCTAEGVCEPIFGGESPPGQVCGCDNKTYASYPAAHQARVSAAYYGACE